MTLGVHLVYTFEGFISFRKYCSVPKLNTRGGHVVYAFIHWQMHSTGWGDCLCVTIYTLTDAFHRVRGLPVCDHLYTDRCIPQGEGIACVWPFIHWQMHSTGWGDCLCVTIYTLTDAFHRVRGLPVCDHLYTDRCVPQGEGIACVWPFIHWQMRSTGWGDCLCVTIFYHPIPWAATQHLQRIYHCFWTVDAVMGGAYHGWT